MKWPWQRRKKEPVRTSEHPDPAGPPSHDLRRAREAVAAADAALAMARSQRPQVAATGRALERTLNRNHLAELVRGALGSGS